MPIPAIKIIADWCIRSKIRAKHTVERQSSEASLREYNIRIVNKYLEKYDNNIKLVAQKLDIGVATIYWMLKQ
jgi:transcriptional regulator with PAS, ATPase and Fis domain